MDNDSWDPKLLQRMMMGDFSPTSAKTNEAIKTPSAKKKMEVDLHFDKLYPEKPNLAASEKLALQLSACSTFIADARKKSVRNGYVIVGKGEGVLKKEVQKLLTNAKISYAVSYDPPYFGNALKVYL